MAESRTSFDRVHGRLDVLMSEAEARKRNDRLTDFAPCVGNHIRVV